MITVPHPLVVLPVEPGRLGHQRLVIVVVQDAVGHADHITRPHAQIALRMLRFNHPSQGVAPHPHIDIINRGITCLPLLREASAGKPESHPPANHRRHRARGVFWSGALRATSALFFFLYTIFTHPPDASGDGGESKQHRVVASTRLTHAPKNVGLRHPTRR